MALLDFFAFIIHIINAVVVPLIFAVAFLTFIWGVFQYFISGDEEKRKKAREFIIYGLIGLVLMVAVWGVVNLVIGTFGFNRTTRPALPYFQGSSFFGGSGSSRPTTGQGTIFGGGTTGTVPSGSTCDPRNPALACGNDSCRQVGSGPYRCATTGSCLTNADCHYSGERCNANRRCEAS